MQSLVVLSVIFVTAFAATCRDGVDNVIPIQDTTNGKGKVVFEGAELWTYDEQKRPSCTKDKKGNFQLPGNFKLGKGSVHIKEAIKENPNKPLQLVLNVEKESWIIGVVCENGVSKNQFVPNELCKFDLCKLVGEEKCGMLNMKTNKAVDMTSFISDELMDIGSMPIPQLAGSWKISLNVLDGKKVIAGIRFGAKGDWVSIETIDDGSVKMESYDPSTLKTEL